MEPSLHLTTQQKIEYLVYILNEKHKDLPLDRIRGLVRLLGQENRWSIPDGKGLRRFSIADMTGEYELIQDVVDAVSDFVSWDDHSSKTENTKLDYAIKKRNPFSHDLSHVVAPKELVEKVISLLNKKEFDLALNKSVSNPNMRKI